jgi:hypothetical protein
MRAEPAVASRGGSAVVAVRVLAAAAPGYPTYPRWEEREGAERTDAPHGTERRPYGCGCSWQGENEKTVGVASASRETAWLRRKNDAAKKRISPFPNPFCFLQTLSFFSFLFLPNLRDTFQPTRGREKAWRSTRRLAPSRRASPVPYGGDRPPRTPAVRCRPPPAQGTHQPPAAPKPCLRSRVHANTCCARGAVRGERRRVHAATRAPPERLGCTDHRCCARRTAGQGCVRHRVASGGEKVPRQLGGTEEDL